MAKRLKPSTSQELAIKRLENSLTVKQIRTELAKRNLLDFTEYTYPEYSTNWHHGLLAEYLQAWINGDIKKLMVFMPPQHGKSELTSRRLPAYLLGIKPEAKIIAASYSGDLAKAFNRDAQKIIDDELFQDVFPKTVLANSQVTKRETGENGIRRADYFEVVKKGGFLKSVGVCGPLTGTPGDYGIIDDPVKDSIEAESPTYRERIWDWYTKVFSTRLHNDSQQLLTMTRWHPDDLAGRILKRAPGEWEVLRLEAIKRQYYHSKDPRQEGQALWPEKHSLERLKEMESLDDSTFTSLYQQDPKPSKSKLIFTNWKEGVFDDSLPFMYGNDFGLNDPDTMVKVAINEKRKKIYVKLEFYQNKQGTDELINRVKEVLKESPSSWVVCDSAEKRLIYDFINNGINAVGAIKGPGSLKSGIKLMQGYTIIVDPGSEEVKNELNSYIYLNTVDKIPKDDNNHTIDPIRYVLQIYTQSAKF